MTSFLYRKNWGMDDEESKLDKGNKSDSKADVNEPKAEASSTEQEKVQ